MFANPYLNFQGKCEEAFKFYAACTGGTIEQLVHFSDMPGMTGVPMDWVAHVRLRIGNSLLMGSDAPGPNFEKPQGFSVSLMAGTPEEADRVFAALAEGGTVRMPIGETPWSPRFGMLTDRFGTPWMVNCDPALA